MTTSTTNPPRLGSATVPKVALSVAEAAEAMSLSPRTIEAMVKAGELPTVRVGRRVLLPVAALSTWLDEQTQQGDGNQG